MVNISKIYAFLHRKCFPLLCMTIAAAGVPWPLSASINGSPHDMSTKQCYFCHTLTTNPGQVPMWSDSPRPRTYVVYVSQTHDMESSQEIQPQSLLCLGCHNGLFSSLVNYLGPASARNEAYDFETNPAFRATLDTDITNDHPVCFTYDPGKDADGNNFPPAVPIPGNAGARAIRGGKTGTLYPLYGLKKDQFECTTCHLAHYNNNDQSSGDYHAHLLRADNSRSTMCRDCHQNKY